MAKGKYETHVLPNLEKITKWAAEGATNKDIAKKLKIAYSSFRGYLASAEKGEAKYQALLEAFAEGTAVADDEIETALHDRAKGIVYFEEVYERKKNEQTGEHELVLVRRTKRYIPPDPTSAMFWLTNRRPKKWKYKQEAINDDDSETGVIELGTPAPEPVPSQEVMDQLERKFADE